MNKMPKNSQSQVILDLTLMIVPKVIHLLLSFNIFTEVVDNWLCQK